MGDLCFRSWEGAAGATCGLAPGGLPSCWWRRLALLPHCGSSNKLRARARKAGCGWFPDGLSGLPTVDSEAPLVWAASSALIQLQGQSPLRNARDTSPLCHQPSPRPSAPETVRQCTSSLSFLCCISLSLLHEVERGRAGNLADGWASSSGSLTYCPLGRRSCIRFWV